MKNIKIVLNKQDYPPHVQRVIEEAEELEIKINKLENFIDNNLLFKELPEIDQSLMQRQLGIMLDYLEILDKRLIF